MLESTAVNKQEEFQKDLVLENNIQAKSLKKIVLNLKRNKVKLGLQISHSVEKVQQICLG